MKARPILFSAPMVRALLAGTKTQTRRVVKPQPPAEAEGAGVITSPDPKADGLWSWLDHATDLDCGLVGDDFRCPYGQPGDLLYVRETWASDGQGGVRYYATDDVHDLRRKRVSIHMPRWASRLTLEITDVRVERLQAISEADALAEGVREPSLGDLFMVGPDGAGDVLRTKAPPLVLWQFLWRQINGDDSWRANPWVWVVEFKVHRANVDAMLANAEPR